jgi:hypothetical protein
MVKWGADMKKLLWVAAAAAFALAGTANAAVTITVDPTVTDYASDLLAVPDSEIIWDFDAIAAAGYNYSPLSATDTGNTPNVARQPTGDNTTYGVVDPTQSPASFTAANGLKKFSFLVGSPDLFNRIVFLRADNSVIADLTGAAAFGPTITPNGSDTAYRVNYEFGGESAYTIQFYSNLNQNSFAFEYDRFAGVVPEPATWGMMILGFFGLGSVLRVSRRRAALGLA